MLLQRRKLRLQEVKLFALDYTARKYSGGEKYGLWSEKDLSLNINSANIGSFPLILVICGRYVLLSSHKH